MVFAGAGFSQTRDIDMKLLRASADGQLETVKSLVRSGANVNASQSEGATPLIVASFYGADDVVDIAELRGHRQNDALFFRGIDDRLGACDIDR